MLPDTHEAKRLGAGGERIAMHLIAHAIEGSVQPWYDDIGLDAAVQFQMTDPYRSTSHLMLQVKTGSCYVADDGGPQLRVRRVNRKHVDAWRREPSLSVAFVWIDPNEPSSAYWHLIRHDLNSKRFFLSKQRRVSPVTRYDWTLLLRSQYLENRPIKEALLRPHLIHGIRDIAKREYRRHRDRPAPVNPILGPVWLPWRAWRHITSQRRDREPVMRSLSLMSALGAIIENPGRFVGLRRVSTFRRGEYCYAIRLVAFSTVVMIERDATLEARCVFRETIRYAAQWASLPSFGVERRVSLESVYEKGCRGPW